MIIHNDHFLTLLGCAFIAWLSFLLCLLEDFPEGLPFTVILLTIFINELYTEINHLRNNKGD